MIRRRLLSILKLILIFSLQACDKTETDTNTQVDQDVIYEVPKWSCTKPFERSRLPQGLFITEVGESRYGYQDWFELYNASAADLDLADFQVRTQQRTAQGVWLNASHTFDLPHFIVPANSYVVVQSTYDETGAFDYLHWSTQLQDSFRVRLFDSASQNSMGLNPLRGSILLLKDNAVKDALYYGTRIADDEIKAWEGAYAPALANSNHYTSLIRRAPYQDTQQAKDWAISKFHTKGGDNDIDPAEMECRDDDHDGLPDCAEQACRTYSGLPYYAWGARKNVQDTFLQISWMETANEITKPKFEALQRLQRVFTEARSSQDIPMKLHIDVGDLYSVAGMNDPEHFHLYDRQSSIDVGQPVPFKSITNLSARSDDEYANVFRYQEQHMDIRRESIFNYGLYAYQIDPESIQVLGIAYVGYYKHFIVGLGAHLDAINETARSESYHANMQASTTLHELGHVLGLSHGGEDRINKKPNYLSSMNYLYIYGLPDLEQAADDRYRQQRCKEPIALSQMHRSVLGATEDFLIGYSAGNAASLNENSLNEQHGLHIDGISYAFDFNCDGDQDDAGVTFDTNPNHIFSDIQESLRDYNDWHDVSRHVDHHVKQIAFLQHSFGDDTSAPWLPKLNPPICKLDARDFFTSSFQKSNRTHIH